MIDKGIPIPPRIGGKRMEEFAAMEVGDSVLFHRHHFSEWAARRAMTRAQTKLGRKFTLRQVKDGARVWRVS